MPSIPGNFTPVSAKFYAAVLIFLLFDSPLDNGGVFSLIFDVIPSYSLPIWGPPRADSGLIFLVEFYLILFLVAVLCASIGGNFISLFFFSGTL